MRSFTLALAANMLICFAVAGIGCGGTQKEPVQADEAGLPKPGSGQEYSPTATWPKGEPPGPTRYIRLHIGEDVAKTCGVTRAHFEFDAAEPLPQDRNELKAIAECLNTPGIKDLPIEVVGRADTKGKTEYNQALGMKRAEHVKGLLVSDGVAAERITTSSRGESEAVGDEQATTGYSEGFDRRVDIMVKGAVHAPQ